MRSRKAIEKLGAKAVKRFIKNNNNGSTRDLIVYQIDRTLSSKI